MLTTGFLSVAPVTSRTVPSSLFILASSVCRFLQHLTSTLTQGGEDGHSFRLTCSAVLWGGRNPADKHRWRVWGALAVPGPHWFCPSSQWHVLSGSTLLRVQGALQGHCPKWALHFVHFPGLNHSGSGSQVLQKGTDSIGRILCPFQVQAAQVTRCLESVPGWLCVYWAQPLSFQVHHKSTVSGMLCVSSGELISGCAPPGRHQPSRIPGRRC